MTQKYSNRTGISPATTLIDEARHGRMVVLLDHESRENEGDLVIPAQFATPQAINFMATYGRGLICLAIEQKRAHALELLPMPQRYFAEDSSFLQSIDAAQGISTGISAADRAHTIAVAINPDSKPQNLSSPGHLFPLEAKPGGLLERAGHTEAGVDLAQLAGLIPAAIICEIMRDDGNMARLPDLISFSERHSLKLGLIEELTEHRKKGA